MRALIVLCGVSLITAACDEPFRAGPSADGTTVDTGMSKSTGAFPPDAANGEVHADGGEAGGASEKQPLVRVDAGSSELPDSVDDGGFGEPSVPIADSGAEEQIPENTDSGAPVDDGTCWLRPELERSCLGYNALAYECESSPRLLEREGLHCFEWDRERGIFCCA